MVWFRTSDHPQTAECAVCSPGFGRGAANECHTCSEGFKIGMYFLVVVSALVTIVIVALIAIYLVRGRVIDVIVWEIIACLEECHGV